uniref:Uncharacterized protein n=1 Tax=Arundo donax TaxID=35708 RepID=A0A0A8YIN5_ARUDO
MQSPNFSSWAMHPPSRWCPQGISLNQITPKTNNE